MSEDSVTASVNHPIAQAINPMNQSINQSISQSMRSNTTGTAVFYTVFLGLAALCIGWIILRKCISNQMSNQRFREANTLSFDREIPVEEVVEEIPGVAAAPVQWPPPDINLSENQPNNQSNQQSNNQPNEQPIHQSRFARLKKLFSRSTTTDQPVDQAIELAPPPINPCTDQSIGQPIPNIPPPSYVDTVHKFNALKISIPINHPTNQPANHMIEPSYVRSPSRSPSLIEFDSEFVQPPSYQPTTTQASTHLTVPVVTDQPVDRSRRQPADGEIVDPQHVAITIPQATD